MSEQAPEVYKIIVAIRVNQTVPPANLEMQYHTVERMKEQFLKLDGCKPDETVVIEDDVGSMLSICRDDCLFVLTQDLNGALTASMDSQVLQLRAAKRLELRKERDPLLNGKMDGLAKPLGAFPPRSDA